VTINGSGAECVSVPLVPFAVTVKVPAATAAGTESVTVWLVPDATEKAEVGEVVLAAGKPDSEMETGPVKPFCPAIDTVKVEGAAPACWVRLVGEMAIVKSCAGGDGGWEELPQPLSRGAPRARNA